MTTLVQKKPSDLKRLTGPALRTFFRIADDWKLNREEQMALLGVTATSTYHNWKKNPEGRLGPDTLDRISYILGIYKALQILLPQPHLADTWVKKPHKALPFVGHSPMRHMLQGHMRSLWEVRDYLDAHRGS